MIHPTVRHGWRGALQAAWLTAALMLLMGVSDNNACAPDSGAEDECSAAADCANMEAPDGCVGQWSCEAGACVFTCDDSEPTGCYGDQDCADGLVCNAAEVCLSPPGCQPGQPCPAVCYGFCVEPEPEPLGCMSSDQCPAGQHCSVADGVCDPAPGCAADMACPAVCYGECVDDEPEACRDDDDCGPGMVCGCLPRWDDDAAAGAPREADMACYPQCIPDPDPGCAVDYDCAPGQACVDGECVGEAGCYSDRDCADGQFCNMDYDSCGGPWFSGLMACMGVCEDEEPEPAGCIDDSDCADGQFCNVDYDNCGGPWFSGLMACMGVCEDKEPEPTGCISDRDCAEGQFCNVDYDNCGGPWPNGLMACMGVCEDKEPGPTECESNSDCATGQICQVSCAAMACACEPGEDCDCAPWCEGVCVDDPGSQWCRTDDDCGENEYCGCGGSYGEPSDGASEPNLWCEPMCLPKPYDCSSDADCDSGICVIELCSGPAVDPLPCDPASNDCGPPAASCYGYCADDPQPPEYDCTTDADCDGDMVCELVMCAAVAMPCFDEDGDGECDDPTGVVPPQCWGFCVEPEPAQCTSDTDCDDGEYCRFDPCPLGPCWYDEETGETHCPPCFGQCAPAPTEGCKENADCLPGQYCEIDHCYQECWDCAYDEDCGGGCQTICEGVCKDEVSPQECTSDADCDEGDTCQCTPNPACPECDVCFMQCLPDEEPPPPGECTEDAQCADGQHCEYVCPPCAACPEGAECPPCECIGVCMDNPDPVYPACGENGDCPAGSTCTCMPDPNCPLCDVCLMQCVPDAPTTCKADADCDEGYYCEQGPCPFFMPCDGGDCPGCDGVCKKQEPEPSPCMATGCSGQVCAAEPVATTCEWTPHYACYQLATCGLNADGECGWQTNDEFAECMRNNNVGD